MMHGYIYIAIVYFIIRTGDSDITAVVVDVKDKRRVRFMIAALLV